jgi:uridine kinase
MPTKIIGIAGGSASGKSTLSMALAQFLEAQTPSCRVEILSADRFYHRDMAKGPTLRLSTSEEELFNFNHPDALDVEGLRGAILSRSTASDAPEVLLVEGLMVLQIPSIRETLDVRIFVELEAEVRALRRMLRDMQGNRGNADPQFIATYYLECARVGHELFVEPSRVHADLIVRGDAEFARLLPLLARVVREPEA